MQKLSYEEYMSQRNDEFGNKGFATWGSENDMEYNEFAAQCDDSEWTDEDEAGLEEYEENKRRRIAEANEY